MGHDSKEEPPSSTKRPPKSAKCTDYIANDDYCNLGGSIRKMRLGEVKESSVVVPTDSEEDFACHPHSTQWSTMS